jgi:predicted kinase
MPDSLFDRAELAIEASYLIREERRASARLCEQHLAALRLAVLESAMARSESRARRDDRQDDAAMDVAACDRRVVPGSS